MTPRTLHYQDRKLPLGERVVVYWNQRASTWSIQSTKTGLVHAHADFVFVTEATMQRGAKRVLELVGNLHGASLINDFSSGRRTAAPVWGVQAPEIACTDIGHMVRLL